jgi:hypothetical protein
MFSGMLQYPIWVLGHMRPMKISIKAEVGLLVVVILQFLVMAYENTKVVGGRDSAMDNIW